MALAGLREEVHARAEITGSVVGPLLLGNDGDRVDCARLGKGRLFGAVHRRARVHRRWTADFVLLGEGHPVNRLSEDKF